VYVKEEEDLGKPPRPKKNPKTHTRWVGTHASKIKPRPTHGNLAGPSAAAVIRGVG
jgi:hypothetical protein